MTELPKFLKDKKYVAFCYRCNEVLTGEEAVSILTARVMVAIHRGEMAIHRGETEHRGCVSRVQSLTND